MSTFAVFGMTLDVAKTEARKKTAGTRKNAKAPGGVEPIPEAEWPSISLKEEPPHVYFGPESAWRWPALVRSVKPSNNDTCAVQAVNYDPRLYDDDNNSPPAE